MNHLHLHTDGSLLDGACNIKKAITRAKEIGSTALGITDHGNMIKAYEFYSTCKEEGIKPLIGCEFYFVDKNEDKNSHLILYAKNNVGLKNLYKLIYEANYNFYCKPRINRHTLKENSEGLICLSACVGSVLGHITSPEELDECVTWFKDLFKEDYYLEIQSNALDIQLAYNYKMYNLSLKHNIEVVVTTDAHYVRKEDFNSHDTLLCMNTKKKKDDVKRFRFTSNDFYMKTSEEIKKQLSYLPYEFIEKAINNTEIIANKCNVTIDSRDDLLPSMGTKEEEKKKLFELCQKGLIERNNEGHYKGMSLKEVKKRIIYEYNVICNKGYAGYFLIVEDFIRFCKENNIPTGLGRGSVCGCEIAFLLRITEVEPIKYGLLFERFLNPTRNSPPDIDTDFCYFRRKEVIEYIQKKYGEKNVAHIMAEGTMKYKAISRRVLGIYGYKTPVISAVSKILDNYSSIKEAVNDVEFTSRVGENEIKDMLTLENLMSHTSTHAAGVIIAPEPIYNLIPVSLDKETNYLASQWHKKIIEKLGLYKFDILGLKTMTILDMTLKMINERHNKNYDLDWLYKIDYNDKGIYEVLNSGNLQGIFQMNGDSAGKVINDMHPTCFEDVMVAESICRPGVKEAQLYISNKKMFKESGIYPKESYHDFLKDILEPTYGAIVYQEQTMLIMERVTGGKWDLGKADNMRKVKNLEEYRQDFINCSVIPKEQANEIFDRFSLEYSFNKSHACAYGKLTCITAYLMYYYPKEFMTCCMSIELSSTENNIKLFIAQCRKMNIEVIPPDINISTKFCTLNEDKIVMALSSISYCGEELIKKIIKEREKGKFSSVENFTDRIPKRKANKRSMEMLIKSGAFDCTNENRSLLLEKYYLSTGESKNVMFWCKEVSMLFENEALGFSLSAHPLDNYTNNDIALYEDNSTISIIGIITNIKEHIDKKGNKMAFLEIENKACGYKGTVFSHTYSKIQKLLIPYMPLVVMGKKEGNNILINNIIKA